DWTAFQNAFYFVSTYASATIPTKQRPYAFWRLPALAFAFHGWQCMLINPAKGFLFTTALLIITSCIP
ncbi:hypothetical protein, partial [Methyloprofundus sp.]|uniref:hypothetical protein n=1 Tax=Methyloprofundus sp. TaxID=2020875 RepID=UPI00261CB3B4